MLCPFLYCWHVCSCSYGEREVESQCQVSSLVTPCLICLFVCFEGSSVILFDIRRVSSHPHWLTKCGDWHKCYQYVELVRWVLLLFVFSTFPIPCPRWLSWDWYRCIHLESPSPSWPISGFLWLPKENTIEAHSTDVLVNDGAVVSGHHLINGRTALFLPATPLCGSHSARPKWEGTSVRDCGKESRVYYLPYFLRQNLSLKLKLNDSASNFPYPSAEITGTMDMPGFLCQCWIWNSGPHAWIVSALPME